MKKISVSWSGGKDCSMALYEVLSSCEYKVESLHTTFNEDTQRVGLHGVQQQLIEAQVSSLGFVLDKIFVSSSMSHDVYIAQMKSYYKSLKAKGVTGVLFGDLFLEDLKVFREELLKECGLEPVFPLWKRDTLALAKEFIRLGFKAVLCSADGKYFNESAAGAAYDESFIANLPAAVDPCGENGEFHTFVYDGPVFKTPITIQQAEVVSKKYEFKSTDSDGNEILNTSSFWFRELLLS